MKPSSFEIQVFLILTIIVLIVKACLSIYLGKKIYDRKKETEKFNIDFVFGIFIFILCMLIGRILYVYFDFVLTGFDPNLYPKHAIIWQIAMFISSIGTAFVLYVIDKKALQFKFKGILAVLVLVGGVIVLVYPINNKADFDTVSAISIVSMAGTILIPIIFIYLGLKIPGLRKTAFMIAIGFIVFGLSAIIVNEFVLNILRNSFGEGAGILGFFFFMILKIVGLSLITYGITKFSL